MGSTRYATGELLHGRFRFERMLGEGGMGRVFLATHLELGEPVAVKEILCAPRGASIDEASFRQAYSEARILAGLRHPRLPRVHDLLQDGDRCHLVMEFVEGETLEAVQMRSGRMDERRVLAWARELCDVLGYLHGQTLPVIFRDMKPSNIILQKDGHLKLIDFGISKLLDPETGLGTLSLVRGSLTHGFAPPEQYGAGTDARSDIYSLGATLYCLLTDRVPPPSARRIAGEEAYVPLAEAGPDVSERTARAVDAMLSLGVPERPQTIPEVERALGFRDLDVPKPPPRRGRKPVIALLVALAIATMVAFWWTRPPRPGRVLVDSDPPGARVYLDGREVGTTPLDLHEVAPGPHALRVGTGEDAVTQALHVEAGEERSMFLRLEEK